MIRLGLNSEIEYVEYYVRHRNQEFRELLSLFTAEHDHFFRELGHFDILRKNVMPALIGKVRARPDRTLHAWAITCGRGPEAFSLAIFLERTLHELAPDLTYQVHGTDADPLCLEFARSALFSQSEVEDVPRHWRGDCFIQGTRGLSDYLRVHPRLMARCHFHHADLRELDSWPRQDFDVIFCRGVIPHSSSQTDHDTLRALRDRLLPYGYLFLHPTESFRDSDVGLKSVTSSVYNRQS
jgi:chemotaxis protein methyltransferase CheR